MIQSNLKLIIDKKSGVRGYDSVEVRQFMESIGKLKEWQKWYNGQTGAIIKGKFCVYTYDFNRFLEGLPNTD